MPLSIHALPVLSDNYAWVLRDSATGTVAVVDPGEAEPVHAYLQAQGNRLDLILLTHHHNDHIGGAEALRQQYGARIVGALADQHRLPPLDIAVQEGDHVQVGESQGRVLAVPGHTLGHISYYFSDPPALFCGDTLFSLGCGRLFEGTPSQLFDSLHKLAALPSQTLVCCGHEYTLSNAAFALHATPDNAALHERVAEARQLRAKGLPTVPSTLGQELATNPFLRAPDAQSLGLLRAEKDTF